MIILHLIIMEVATSWIALVSPTYDVCLPASRVVLEVRNHFRSKIPIGTNKEARATLSIKVSKTDPGVWPLCFSILGDWKANIVIPRSYEGIIPKVTANVCLDNFPADTIAGNEIFILALRARVISRASSHFVSKREKRFSNVKIR